MSILHHVPPGFVLRPGQRKALLETELNWKFFDVLVVPGPVAFGKSLYATTVARWRASLGEKTSIPTPQVLLQDQYGKQKLFPVLKGRNRYECHSSEGYRNCAEKGDKDKEYCYDCPYLKTLTRAKAEQVAVYNYHSYIFNRAYSPNLIVDEAHELQGFFTDHFSFKVWQHKDGYPDNIETRGDICSWVEKYIRMKERELKEMPKDHKNYNTLSRKIKKFKLVMNTLHKSPGDFLVERRRGKYRHHNSEDYLLITPTSMENLPHHMWPATKVNKIILMSATINDDDIKSFGLKNRKVKYLYCESPIPVDNRPFIVAPVANMSYRHQKTSIPKIAKALLKIADFHTRTKGLVHCTYSVAIELKRFLKNDPRFMFHNKHNKSKVYEEFRESKNPVILVASGMDQGIDLAGQEFGWQAITKVQWPSKKDSLISVLADKNPRWYIWQAVKMVIQQYGRICRTPTDYGITYMLDSSFVNLYDRNRAMFPEWLKESMVWKKT